MPESIVTGYDQLSVSPISRPEASFVLLFLLLKSIAILSSAYAATRSATVMLQKQTNHACITKINASCMQKKDSR